MGNGEQGMGIGEWGTGNGEWGLVNGEQGSGIGRGIFPDLKDEMRSEQT